MKYWDIEYEIPPMRAIYRQECDGAYSEEDVRKAFEIQIPEGRIRKLIKSTNDSVWADPISTPPNKL